MDIYITLTFDFQFVGLYRLFGTMKAVASDQQLYDNNSAEFVLQVHVLNYLRKTL